MSVESITRRVDSMPASGEAQREPADYELGWRDSISFKNVDSGYQLTLRVRNFIKVFVKSSDDRYEGYKAMFDKKEYPYKVGDKSVMVMPNGVTLDKKFRKFIVKSDDGIETEVVKYDPNTKS